LLGNYFNRDVYVADDIFSGGTNILNPHESNWRKKKVKGKLPSSFIRVQKI